MHLQDPRVTSRATHSVYVRIDAGPTMQGTRGYRDRTPDPSRRFRADTLRVRYEDGDLIEVSVTGVKIRADGQPYEQAGRTETAEYLTDDGLLRPDTPDWVREVVEAHPWPASRPTPSQVHQAEAIDLLPWAPTDTDGLAYRQQRIAAALAEAEQRGATTVAAGMLRALARTRREEADQAELGGTPLQRAAADRLRVEASTLTAAADSLEQFPTIARTVQT